MDPVPFDLLEEHKENIQPLKEGRSAHALVSALADGPIASRTRQDSEREALDKRISEAEELDDPLEPYLEYIKWTTDNYPMGSTSESGLVPLLEQVTCRFRDDPMYKDDPRFLRVWMQYIKFSDAPKEVFLYLAKKEIGKHLATYYEEYAAFLEIGGKPHQAHEVYQLGLQENARPIERLKRRYQEFCERMNANPPSNEAPSSPVLPVVRPALASLDSSGVTGGLSVEPIKPSTKSKLQVFSDSSESSSTSAAGATNWGTIGSLSSRRKENIMAATPWQGETIQMSEDYKQKSFRPAPIYRDAPVPGQRRERIGVALQFLINQQGQELCMEEMLATARGLLNRPFPRSDAHQPPIIQEPNSPVRRPASPTMTAFTKAATDDVYDMFNQPLAKDNNTSSEDDDDASENSDDDNSDNSDEEIHYESDDDTGSATPGMGNLIQKADELLVNDLQRTNDVQSSQRTKQQPVLTAISETNEVETSTYGNTTSPPSLPIINPASVEVRKQHLDKIEGFLSHHSYYSYPDVRFNKYPSLKASLPFKSRKSGPPVSAMTVVEFPNRDDLFCFKKCLGAGGYGCVYLAETGLGELKAVKVEDTTIAWEFYILKSAIHRLQGDRNLKSIVPADKFYQFQDESYLVMDYMPQGTSLELRIEGSNLYEGNGLPEIAVMFFAVELIRVLDSLHRCGIMHGDMKADNAMIRINPKSLGSRTYNRHGENGWDDQGIVLIDFGRGIDLELFGHGSSFVADWGVDNEDCQEMRDGKPWTFQADYYGLAGIIYTLLFGQKISTVANVDSNGLQYFEVSQPFKRYWQKNLWVELFSILLNPVLYCQNSGIEMPLSDALTQCRNKFEDFLEANCESQGNSLWKCLQDLGEQMYLAKK